METEEVQIKGRTARQGQNGSYGMVLLMQDAHMLGADGKSSEPRLDTLEHFSIMPADMTNQPHAGRHDYLSQKRSELRSLEAKTIDENLAVANDRDRYVTALLQNDRHNSCKHFKDIYTQLKGSYLWWFCWMKVVQWGPEIQRV